jgi:protein-arginine kinase activator protein McsA
MVKYEGFRVDPEFAEKLDKEELVTFIEELKHQIFLTEETLIMAVEEEDFEEAKELRDEE